MTHNTPRFLRSRALEFDLDPDRIWVYGTRTGSSLAAILDFTQPEGWIVEQR